MAHDIINYNIAEGFLWSEVNLKGERKYYVEGYASTNDEDLSGEVIDAQQDIYDQILNRNITLDIDHEEWYDEDGKILQRPKNTRIPVAKIVHAEMKSKGVWVKAEINTHLPSFKSVWGSIKDGFLKAFSIAFYPITKAGNTVKKLNLVNITLTGSPVNPQATFQVAMKSMSALIAKEAEDNNMTEENKTETIVENTEVAEPQTVVQEENSIEETVPETIVNNEPEHNNDAIAELKAEINSLKELTMTLKAELEKPVMKAVVENAPRVVEEQTVYVSPLNLIK